MLTCLRSVVLTMNKVILGEYVFTLADYESLDTIRPNWQNKAEGFRISGKLIGGEPKGWASFVTTKPRQPYGVSFDDYFTVAGRAARAYLTAVVSVQEQNHSLGFGEALAAARFIVEGEPPDREASEAMGFRCFTYAK